MLIDVSCSLVNDPDRPGPEFPRPPDTPPELWRLWIREGWFEWEPDGLPYWSHQALSSESCSCSSRS